MVLLELCDREFANTFRLIWYNQIRKIELKCGTWVDRFDHKTKRKCYLPVERKQGCMQCIKPIMCFIAIYIKCNLLEASVYKIDRG